MDDHAPHTSDWHTNNPRLSPGLWIVSIFAAVPIILVLVGFVGGFLNRDGAPRLH
jgi:hypothetical protein